MKLRKPYPLDGARLVQFEELGIPESRLNLGRLDNFNNHHGLFTRARMAQLAITQTWRDLESNQIILPRDTHYILHNMYEPPVLPSMKQIMERLDEAYENDERLRYGSALNPTYETISFDTWLDCHREYNGVKEVA